MQFEFPIEMDVESKVKVKLYVTLRQREHF